MGPQFVNIRFRFAAIAPAIISIIEISVINPVTRTTILVILVDPSVLNANFTRALYFVIKFQKAISKIKFSLDQTDIKYLLYD